MISCKNLADAELICKVVKAAKLWIHYNFICKSIKLEPNVIVHNWIFDIVNISSDQSLLIDYNEFFGEGDYGDLKIFCFHEFLKINKLLKNIVYKDFKLDPKNISPLFQCLTIPNCYQIQELSIIE